MDPERKPAPGSAKARENGCTCPLEENQGGKGVAHMHPTEASMSPNLSLHFCIAQNCPLHGFRI